jgi:hypothetical protein
MPRIPNALLRQARAIDAFLPALLAPCRDLHTAQNELRWLREHVNKIAKARRARGDILAKGAFLHQLVRERALGKPLQYILGTEHFGDLEIRCRPGALIPRWVASTLSRNLTNRRGQTRHCSFDHAPCTLTAESAWFAARTAAPGSLHRHGLHTPPLPARALLYARRCQPTCPWGGCLQQGPQISAS